MLDCAHGQQKEWEEHEEEIDKEKTRQEVDASEEAGKEATIQQSCEEGSASEKILRKNEGVEENKQQNNGACAEGSATVLA